MLSLFGFAPLTLPYANVLPAVFSEGNEVNGVLWLPVAYRKKEFRIIKYLFNQCDGTDRSTL